MGPPGTGKTCSRVPLQVRRMSLSLVLVAQILSKCLLAWEHAWDLFEQGKKHAPCIIFIDEIDAVGRHRGLD